MASVRSLSTSFARVQRAEGKSPHTVKLYRDCIERLAKYVDDDLSQVTRRTLTDFYAERSETVSPATVWTDFKVHRVFLKWLVSEDEMPSNPMDRMKQPKQPVVPVPVLKDDEVVRLLATCQGRHRRDKRDLALIRLAIDTGVRRGELAGLRLEDIDLDEGLMRVTGKGKTRIVPIGSKALMALDRHIRANHPTDSVFGLTPSGIGQAFKERAKQAGVEAHMHMTRHHFAHSWLSRGGSETDLMSLAGWSSRNLLDRYGSSLRQARSIDASRRLAIGDRW